MKVDFEYHSHEVNPHLANIVSPTEVIVVSSFHIELEGGGGDIHVVFPYSMIEPIRTILDAGVQSDTSEIDERWAVLLKEELMHAKVELSGLFMEKELKLADLINLQAGDIIPIDMPELVTLSTDDMPLMKGEYGEHMGNVAVKVDHIVELMDADDDALKNLQLTMGKKAS